MTGILALLGSGEFTDKVVEIDKFLIKHLKVPKKVAILPTAAGQEADRVKWIEKGINYFKKLGVNAEGIHMFKRDDAMDLKLAKHLKEDFNFYYYSGGDPGYLLDTIKDSLAWKVIQENYIYNDSVLACSSAGAMVMGKSVWARVYDYDRKGLWLPWESGLALTDFGIIPHYKEVSGDFKGEKLKELKNHLPINVPIVGIDENTAYIKAEGSWFVKGEGEVHIPAFSE